MHTQPYQPLSDLDALRNENERLRNLLSRLADYVDRRCDYRTQALESLIAQAKQDDLFLESDPTLE